MASLRTVSAPTHPTAGLWPRWVAANAVAECAGLGLSGLLAARLVFAEEARVSVLAGALITILVSTLIEGTAVGYLQWRVLRRALPALPLRAWWLGTAAGALLAWTLGMAPSTLINLSQAAAATPDAAAPAAAEPSQALTLLLAALLGAVAGPLLGIGQWWALRVHLPRAWRWIWAQSLAWAAGMPIIFQMMDWASRGGFAADDLPLIGAMLLLAGGVVGALHGWVLVRMLRE